MVSHLFSLLFCGPRCWSRSSLIVKAGGCCRRGNANSAAKRWRRGTVTGEAGWGRARGAELLRHTGLLVLFLSADMGKGLVRLRRAEQFFVAAMAAQPGRLHHLGARLPVPGMMEQHMFCLSMHPGYSWVLPACVCGAGCWWKGQKNGYSPMFPGAGRGQEWRLGMTDHVLCMLMMTGQAFPLPFSPPASETGDVCVLNCPLVVSHGRECPSQLLLCGGEPCASSTCTFKGQGRDCHQPKHPATL